MKPLVRQERKPKKKAKNSRTPRVHNKGLLGLDLLSEPDGTTTSCPVPAHTREFSSAFTAVKKWEEKVKEKGELTAGREKERGFTTKRRKRELTFPEESKEHEENPIGLPWETAFPSRVF